MAFETMAVRGTVAHYGRRKTNMKYGGIAHSNLKRTAIWDFNYNDLPDAGTANLEQVIPLGSTIISAKFRVITAFTSTSTTTDLTVGLQRADGTEIDNDGLLTAANLTQTVIGTVGDYITGTGALIGKLSDATYNGELSIAPTVDDLLTGRGQVIVEYFLPAATQQS